MIQAQKIKDDNPHLTDTELLQLCFDLSETAGSKPVVKLNNLRFELTDTVRFHKDISIDGEGSYIIGTTARDFNLLEPKFGQGITAAEAQDLSSRPEFRNMSFFHGKDQLTISGTTKYIADNLFFDRGIRGIHSVFAMGGRITSCHFTNMINEGIVARTGLSDVFDPAYYVGATGSNSQSNMGVIEGCRFFSTNGQQSNIRIDGGSNWSLRDITFEGANPKYDVIWNTRNSTTAVDISMDNLHIEHGCSIAHISINGNMRNATIGRVYKQGTSQGVLVEGFGVGKIYFDKASAIAAGTKKWRSDNKKEWIFSDSHMSLDNAFAASQWDGTRPKEIAMRWAAQLSGIGLGARLVGYGDKAATFIVRGSEIREDKSKKYNTGEKAISPIDVGEFEVVGLKEEWIQRSESSGYIKAYSPIFQIKPKIETI